jgi:dTDP-4-amino-4,6-dideoxy-D-galactose acyltransferase
MRQVTCQVLPWDSDFFGFRIARLQTAAPSEDDLAAALCWCRASSVRCLYFLCGAEAIASAQLACQSGFDPVDIRISLVRQAPGEPLVGKNRSKAVTRGATEDDLPALVDLAARSFSESRFYADRRFPRQRVDALYRRWIERDLRSVGRKAFLAEIDGLFAGFASGSIEAGGEGQISLVAVHETARGQGVGPMLIERLLRFFHEQAATRVLVATQGRNTRAIGLYESCGFRTASVELWFHRWFDHSESGLESPVGGHDGRDDSQ